MNCLQIVSLIYWAQLELSLIVIIRSCELLTDCIFDILSTTLNIIGFVISSLWIAYRLYLWYIEHNRIFHYQIALQVVNCLQIVSLIYWAQQYLYWLSKIKSCELLTDCIFDILSTTNRSSNSTFIMLWIAYRLYLWYIEHNRLRNVVHLDFVVNCLQIVSLIYWAQPSEE